MGRLDASGASLRVLVAVLLAAALVGACSRRGGGGGGGGDPVPDDDDAVQSDCPEADRAAYSNADEPDRACLPGIPCAGDTDCPDGNRCNRGLSPPACQQLYCGQEFSACSSDPLCAEGMQCHEGRCNPCDFCGIDGRCEMTFDRDPANCGCCDQEVPDGFVCRDGEPVCEGTICDGQCVDTDRDSENCGGCGIVCQEGRCQEGGWCDVSRTSLVDCDTICDQGNARCIQGPQRPGAVYRGWCESVAVDLLCTQVPGDAITCGTGPSCNCTFDTVYCACLPR